jgi:hypothetical protein
VSENPTRHESGASERFVPLDWQRLDEHEHLRIAIATEALDTGDLAAATAAMFCALEMAEREKLATPDTLFSADDLVHRMNARRAR